MKTPKFKIRPSNHKRYNFELIIPKEWSETGSRKRAYFETEGEAKAERDKRLSELNKFGSDLASMPTLLRVDAMKAHALIKHIPGATLEKIASEYAERYEAKKKSLPLKEVIAKKLDSMRNLLTPLKPKTVSDAAYHYKLLTLHIPETTSILNVTSEMLLEALKQHHLIQAKNMALKREETLRKHAEKIALREKIRKENKGLPRGQRKKVPHLERRLTELKVKSCASKTIINVHRNWSSLFNFAIDKKMISDNPLKGVLKPKHLTKRIKVLSPEQTMKLLIAAAQYAPEMLPYLVIAVFAGPRRSELMELKYEDIGLESGGIVLDDGITKTASRRRLKMSPNLIAWLRVLIGEKEGWVLPREIAKKFDRVMLWLCEKAGIPREPNFARHGFGSYHYEFHSDPNLTMLELGHSTRKMLDENYRELVTPQDAEAYFNLFPPANLRALLNASPGLPTRLTRKPKLQSPDIKLAA